MNATCNQCHRDLGRSVLPQHLSRVKCDECKMVTSRIIKSRYKSTPKGAESRKRELQKKRQKHKELVLGNSACRSCLAPLPPPTESLCGWSQRKCEAYKAKREHVYRARNNDHANQYSRRYYWERRESMIARNKEWKSGNKERVAITQERWMREQFPSSLGYAAQVLARATGLPAALIPRELREAKREHLQAARLLKQLQKDAPES